MAAALEVRLVLVVEYNHDGPRVYESALPGLAALDVEDFRLAVGGGAELGDIRRVERFAAGHLPGALSIELRPQFQSWLGWLGWLVPPGRRLASIVDASRTAVNSSADASTSATNSWSASSRGNPGVD